MGRLSSRLKNWRGGGSPSRSSRGSHHSLQRQPALGTQLTLRGVSETLIVTRPAGKTLSHDQIAELSSLGSTMVIFLGTEKLGEITKKLNCPQDTPAAVVYHASWPDQKIVRGTIADIAQKAQADGIEHTALLIVGGVVDPHRKGYTRSYLYS